MDTLLFWEDMCAISVLQKRVSGATNYGHKVENTLSLWADKYVRDFKNLQVDLLSKKPINSTAFLPEVPKFSKGWFDKIDYSRMKHFDADAVYFYPYALSQWMKTKKVFRFENDGIIPLISPAKANYLNLLPCDSFIINFLEPLEVGVENSDVVKRYKSCVVTRSEKVIDTFWIPDDIETKGSLSPHQRKLLRETFKGKKINEKSLNKLCSSLSISNPYKDPPHFYTLTYHIEKPLMFGWKIPFPPDFEVVSIYHDLYSNPASMVKEYNQEFGLIPELEDIIKSNNSQEFQGGVKMQKIFFELLNGFCFMMSEIKPKTPLLIPGKDTESTLLSREFVWNEIPITKVDYINDSDFQNELKIGYGSGEKSPHVRRGHWRNILKKDGSTEKVWIDQVMVRQDKLEKEELKGNVTVVKEKRET